LKQPEGPIAPATDGRTDLHVHDRAETTDDSRLAVGVDPIATLPNERRRIRGARRIRRLEVPQILVERQVEVYTDPAPAGYLFAEIFREGQSVPVVIDGQLLGLIAVSDILPSERTG
jgi:hypothetical protein